MELQCNKDFENLLEQLFAHVDNFEALFMNNWGYFSFVESNEDDIDETSPEDSENTNAGKKF